MSQWQLHLLPCLPTRSGVERVTPAVVAEPETTDGMARALVLEAPGRLVEHSVPLPDTGDDDALLAVEACGLCGTDHEQYAGLLAPGFAFVPGHETIGTIERIGAAAAAEWGVEEGDRVAVEVFQSCRRCRPCRSGDYRHCIAHGIGDMVGFVPFERPPGLWGGYATHQYLGPDAKVLPVPPSLDPVVATLFNPLGAGIRWGVTVPGTRPGDVVAVLGPGVRGLSVLVAAKEVGAGFVMVTGNGRRDAERLETARLLGADLTVDVSVEDPVTALRSALGRAVTPRGAGRAHRGGADVVVDVTAKAPSALGQAVDLVRPGGTVVVAGTRGSDDTPGFHPDHLVYKEVRLIGALGVDTTSYRAAIDLLASGRYRLATLPRTAVGFAEVAALLAVIGGENVSAETSGAPTGRSPASHPTVNPASPPTVNPASPPTVDPASAPASPPVHGVFVPHLPKGPT